MRKKDSLLTDVIQSTTHTMLNTHGLDFYACGPNVKPIRNRHRCAGFLSDIDMTHIGRGRRGYCTRDCYHDVQTVGYRQRLCKLGQNIMSLLARRRLITRFFGRSNLRKSWTSGARFGAVRMEQCNNEG